VVEWDQIRWRRLTMVDTATAPTRRRPDHQCDIEDDRIGLVRIVRVVGRLDWATMGGFRDLMLEKVTEFVVIVNLDRAELDAAGTGIVMTTAATAIKRGQTLVFVVTNPIELEVLESLGLSFMAPVVASEREALALVGRR
jgi:anti-anti-sigma regulatory factor